MTLEQINQKAIEYAKLKHKDEYNDPAFGRDISESEIDFARGYTAALADQRAKMPSEEEMKKRQKDRGDYLQEMGYPPQVIVKYQDAIKETWEWLRNQITEKK